MSILNVDNKGRITLPKNIRDTLRIGEKVLIINVGDHLKIIPLPSDPFKILHGAFNTQKSFQELRRQAEKSIQSELSQ